MKLMVTGTAGFIGFNLARKLLEEGHTVVGIDNLNDYYYVGLKRKRHDILKDYDSFTPAEIDLCDFKSMETLFAKQEPEVVCNLAAQAGVRYSLTNPFAYQKSNMEGFLNIIELSKRHKVNRFVYASSSSVYAGVKEVPFSESQRVDSPISLYAATKKSNELMAHCYSHLFGLQTVGLRFFTVYGPWGRPDMAMWLFTEAIMAGKPIDVYNFGNMRRDFTYIDDIVAGTAACLFTEGLPHYSIFNLGNNKTEDLLYMIDILEKNLGKTAEKHMMEMQPGDVAETYADIEKAQKMLGFSPTTRIEEGIPKFIDWYMSDPELADAVRASR
ncbi:MAG: GDP-mannose 4,6-dehydratase [Nitrospinota bacterium]